MYISAILVRNWIVSKRTGDYNDAMNFFEQFCVQIVEIFLQFYAFYRLDDQHLFERGIFTTGFYVVWVIFN